jgi:hypothetical protein
VVRILESGEPGAPGDAVAVRSLPGEEVVPSAFGRVSGRDVVRRGQVPGLGIAVAVIGHADGTVDMRDDGDRAGVGAGSRIERGPRVAAFGSARRVCPVQRLVDREQVRQKLPVVVQEVVDPLDSDGPIDLRFDRQRRRMVEQEAVLACRLHRAVPPDDGRWVARRQDLLLDLPHRDLVVVGRLAARHRDRPGSGHDRRDQQRRLIFRNAQRVERPTGDWDGERRGCAHTGKPAHQIEAGAGPAHPLDERRSGYPHSFHWCNPSSPRCPWAHQPSADRFRSTSAESLTGVSAMYRLPYQGPVDRAHAVGTRR